MSRDLAPPHLLEEAWSALRRRFVAMGCLFALLLSGVLAVLLFYPKSYGSEGLLYVQLGRSVASLDPTSTTGQVVNLQESRETEIRSIAEFLESRSLAEKVVDRVGLERVLASSFPEIPMVGLGDLKAWLGLAGNDATVAAGDVEGVEDSLDPLEYERLREREKAVNLVMSRLSVRPGQRNTVINITAEAATPFLAREIVQTFMDVYREEHLRVHRTEGSLAFFQERSEALKQRLVEAEEAIREYKIANRIVTLEGERALIQQEMERLELGILESQADLAASTARRSRLSQLISDYSETETTQVVRGSESATASGVRNRLYELQVEFARLQSSLQPDHPRLLVLAEQIELAEREGGDVREEVVQETEQPNSKRRTLELDLDQEQAKIDGLEVRLTSMRGSLEASRVRLESLAETEVRLAELERTRDVAKADFEAVTRKRAEAEVLEELDRSAISNVAIAQPATLVLKHVAPKGSLVLGLGAMASAVLSLALGISLERRAERRRNRFLSDATNSSVVRRPAHERVEWGSAVGARPAGESRTSEELIRPR